MKIQIERDVYLSALTKVSGTIESRNTMPILAHIHHEAEGNTLTLRATDLDLEVTTRVECIVDQPGKCTLQSDLLNSIVKKYKRGPMVDLDATGTRAEISQGRSKFNLSMLPPEDYPKLASDEYTAQFSMSAGDMFRMLSKTAFAMSQDEVRYYLNGVYLHNTEDGICVVSTDGHRFAKSWFDQNEDFPPVIIPRKTVMEMRKIIDIGDVSISVSDSKIRIDTGDTVIVSKVIDHPFPDYQRVIPTGLPDNFRIDAASFASAAASVALVCEDKQSRGVTVTIGEDSVALSVTGQQNAAEDVVDASVYGGQCKLGFNSKYLADALAQADGGDVDFFYDASQPTTPALVKTTEDDHFLAVIMPMRI